MDIAVYLTSPLQFRGCCLSDYPFTFGDHHANQVAAAYQNMCDMLIKRGVHRFTYLYFGAEFCEYLIPSQQDLEQYVEICRANDLRPVFVTPVVTDRGLDRLRECFDHLDASGIPYAVVVNDLGVLQLLCSRPRVPELIAGRILDKTSHDCRISENEMGAYYSASGMRYASEPGILSDHSTGILAPLGISRYEFDLPKTGLDLKRSGSGRGLYWPFHYLTTGRVCMFRALGKTGRRNFSSDKPPAREAAKRWNWNCANPSTAILLSTVSERIISIYSKRETRFSTFTKIPILQNRSNSLTGSFCNCFKEYL